MALMRSERVPVCDHDVLRDIWVNGSEVNDVDRRVENMVHSMDRIDEARSKFILEIRLLVVDERAELHCQWNRGEELDRSWLEQAQDSSGHGS